MKPEGCAEELGAWSKEKINEGNCKTPSGQICWKDGVPPVRCRLAGYSGAGLQYPAQRMLRQESYRELRELKDSSDNRGTQSI